MATSALPCPLQSSKERTNYARLCRAIVDLGASILRVILTNQIDPSQIRHAAQSCHNLKFNASQRNILNTALGQGYTLFDVSLLYTLIRNLCPSLAPTNGWSHGSPPAPTEITEGDDVERIHFIRNNIYGHLHSSRVLDVQYNQYWQIFQDVASRTDVRHNTTYGKELSQLETCCMDDVTEANFIQTIKEMEEEDRELRLEVQHIQRQLQNMRDFHRLGADNQVTTLSMINGHRNDKSFLCTRAATAGLKKLEDNGILIYSGIAGSGKSSNALEVAKQFLDVHPSYVALSVNDVTKWESYVSPGIDTLVIFDDFLGNSNANKHILQEGKKYWAQIYACVQFNRLKVIMTTRNHILEESFSELETCKIFRKKHIINLSSANYGLSHEEKLAMFRIHGQMNNIGIVSCVDQENYSSEEVLDDEKAVRICEATVKRIIASKPLMGFPQALVLYFSDRKYTRLGYNFFFHPSQSLVKEMDNLKISTNLQEKLKFCILVYTLMQNKETDLEKLDNDIWSNVTETFQLPGTPNEVTIKNVVKSMTNKYITNVDKTYVYRFKHVTILEAVAVSLGNSSVELLLKCCDMEFITEFIRTKQYKVKEGEVIIILKSTSEYVYLVNRFMHDLVTVNDKYRWVDHPAVDDPEFVACWIGSVQSNDEYVKVIRDCCSEFKGMFYWACSFDKYDFVDALYTHYHKYINTDLCLKCAGLTATRWLLDHQVDVDSIVFDLYCIDTVEKLNVMLSHPSVTLTHLTQCIDSHGMPLYNTESSTVKIILERWPDIEIKYLEDLLFQMNFKGNQNAVDILESFIKKQGI